MAKTRTNKNQKTKSQTTLENAFLAPLDPADRLRHEVTSREAKWDIIFLTIVLLVLFIAFTRRAFHIDDPLFIWTARHIQTNPTNPYGFSVNWYGLDMPMWEVAKNPPLVSYYILLAASMLGWSEPALHFAFMVPALAAAIGMYLIARRFCRYPLLAVLAGLLTPVFFVSTLTVMSDMMMLAFFVFAVHFWIKGLDSNSYGCLALAGLLIGISAITKYFGMALIPLLGVYSIFKKRRVEWRLLYLGIPIAILIWYQWTTAHLYGRGLLLDAAAYATEGGSAFGRFSITKAYVAFA